jgi:hypothetical protein
VADERGGTIIEYRLDPSGGSQVVQTVTGGTFTTDVPYPLSVDCARLV